MFLIMFGLIFVRYLYYGFEYFYQLDDYIQYHNYRAYHDDLWGLINDLGMLSARPLAGPLDIFVWSHLYPVMIIAVGIISAMYALSGIFLHRVFSRRFGTGSLFFIIYCLLPLGFEGIYWVSASSRIVVGMFFAAAALFCFDTWCADGRKRNLLFFAVLQFTAFCFYEQVILFSGAATLVIMLCEFKNENKRGLSRFLSFENKRSLLGFFMFANAGVYLIITSLAPSGVYGDRTALFLPWEPAYVHMILLPALRQMFAVFVRGNSATLGRGSLRGLETLVSEPNILYLFATVTLCTLFYLCARGEKTKGDDIKSLSGNNCHAPKQGLFYAQFFAGLFLTLVPLLLFFVLRNPWFGVRNAVTSFCGLALMGDALLGQATKRLRTPGSAQALIASLLAFLCCVAAISQLRTYRDITIADTEIAKAAARALETEIPSGDIWLLNVDASYAWASFFHHEHGHGVTSSDWALTGAVRAISGRGEIPMLRPISTHRTELNISRDTLYGAALFYLSDGEFVPVCLQPFAVNEWKLEDSSGRILGTISHHYGNVALICYDTISQRFP